LGSTLRHQPSSFRVPRPRLCVGVRMRLTLADTPTQSRGRGTCNVLFEDAQFLVRTLQRGAHLRRNPRGFPRCALFESAAHLRTKCAPSTGRAVALGYPLAGAVPLSRKVVLALASASIMLSCFKMHFIDKPAEAGRNSAPRIARQHLLRTLRIICPFPCPPTRLAKQKSRAWIFDPDTAPRRRDLQLVAVPYLVLATSLFGQ
jgi:hypothetical protein